MSVALHAVRSGTGPPLLIAHGLFGSARNWGVIQKRLSDAFAVTAVDMRNHGDSPWDAAHGYGDLASDLGAAIDAGPDGAAHVLGHSMGGKAAMALALTRPGRVRRLIVADIAPVAYGHSQSHLIDALRRIDLASVETRGDADRQLARHIEEPGVRAFLLQSLDIRARRWRLNLDVLDREMDRITGWEALPGRFDGPALFLSGAASSYVRPAHHAAIRAQFPAATFVAIPDAGHWLHAERPREAEAAIRAFLLER